MNRRNTSNRFNELNMVKCVCINHHHRARQPKAITRLEDSRILITFKKYPDKSPSNVVKVLNLKVSNRTAQAKAKTKN